MRHIFVVAITAIAVLSTIPAVAGEGTSKPTATNPDQAIKCRKVEVTGSLVRKGKVCRTVAEWKRLQQLGNDAARVIAGEHICSGGECRGFEPPPNGE